VRLGAIIRIAFVTLIVSVGLASESFSKDDDAATITVVNVVNPSSEVCPVTVPNPEPTLLAPPDYLATNYDFAGSDQGISVDDSVDQLTWFFAGDSKAADDKAWFGVYEPGAGGANVIGYLGRHDYGNPESLCERFQLTTVPGMTSTAGGGVYSPDVMVAPAGDSIDNYIFTQTPNLTAATVPILPPNSGIPGIDEATTGAFFVPSESSFRGDGSSGWQGDGSSDSGNHGGTMYLFYAGSPGLQIQSDGSKGLPITSVSYLADWKKISPVGTIPNVSPTTYSILARVDYSTENDTTSCYPSICPPGPPSSSWPAKPPLGGHFVWVDAVVAGDAGGANPYIYLFGTGKFRASHVYLARIRENDLDAIGHCAAAPCYLGQARGFQIWTTSTPSGTPHWSPSDSAPSTEDIANAAYLCFPDDPTAEYGQISVRHFDNVDGGGLWLMLAAPTGGYNSPPFTSPYDQRIIARWAKSPEGSWSDALTVFDMRSGSSDGSQNQGRYCCQGVWNGKLDPNGLKVWECQGQVDGKPLQQCMECQDAQAKQQSGTPGAMRFGFYAPDMLPYLTEVSSSSDVRSGTRYETDTFTVNYLLSIFEPYNSVLFKFTMQTVSSSRGPDRK
jgi:hypothetical protein